MTWTEFVREHVEKTPGERNAILAQRTLNEFGASYDLPPHRVTFGMVEAFVEDLKAKENNQEPVNL